MKIGIVKELENETIAPIIPTDAARLVKLGAEVSVEAGTGVAIGYKDSDYRSAGASILPEHAAILAVSDILLRLRKPKFEEVNLFKPESIHVSFLDPFHNGELLRHLATRRISAISMELIPRITRAQRFDALTSFASLAGYVAVILAAQNLNKIFPMMMTAAGTIFPARVLVIGAGVAGLQAIATARRLGAKVEAYDTRSDVSEQIRSLGARSLKIDLGKIQQTKEGYATPLTDAQLRKQCNAITKFCAAADVVITAAQVFGRKAPLLVTLEMIAAMKPASVIVDLAVEQGGNVEGIACNQITDRHGVKLIGLANLPGRVPAHASQVYSANVTNFIEEFWDKASQRFVLNLNDPIIQSCLATHEGKICHEHRFQLREGNGHG